MNPGPTQTTSAPLPPPFKRAGRAHLYEVVSSKLLERIKSGAIPVGTSLPSERELCLEFNVSRQTMRNALAQLSLKGVIESRAGSGHFACSSDGPRRKANGEKNGARITRQIGVICPPKYYLNDPNQWKTLMGLKGRISQEGYSLAMSVSQKDEKNGFSPCYQHWLEDGDMAGYIGISVNPAMQRRLHESGYPSLVMGYVWEDIPLPSIAVDFRLVYENILEHLAREGHTRVVTMLNNPDTLFTSKVKEGIARGIQKLGWKEDQVVIRRYNDNAYDLVSSIRAVIRSDEPAPAIVLQGEDHLDAVMRFFEIEGVRLPDDCHVLVAQFSDTKRAAYGDKIVFFNFDYLWIGQMIGQRMLDIIAGKQPDPLHQEVLLGEIVDARASSARVAA